MGPSSTCSEVLENLLKGGPPSRELVRLYEDAAWLYVQSGDNMLAIYASEKALRIAQQLGEATAVSRAYGIFGRVFSRTGDAERARENLRKAVNSATGADDPLEAVLALIALGGHLEVAEADYAGAGEAYAEALDVAERIGDVASQVELHCVPRPARRPTGGLGRCPATFGDRSAELAEGAGLVLKLCLPHVLTGVLRWRAGNWNEAETSYRRAVALAEDVGWSEVAFAALYGLAVTQRDRGDYEGAAASLERGLAIAERAGLTVQAILALAGRAVVLTLGDRREEAAVAAERAAETCRHVHSPVGEVATLEARGATATPDQAAPLLTRARDGWDGLGRPLEITRLAASSWPGCSSVGTDSREAARASAAAADAFEDLGVAHLAARARELAMP